MSIFNSISQFFGGTPKERSGKIKGVLKDAATMFNPFGAPGSKTKTAIKYAQPIFDKVLPKGDTSKPARYTGTPFADFAERVNPNAKPLASGKVRPIDVAREVPDVVIRAGSGILQSMARNLNLVGNAAFKEEGLNAAVAPKSRFSEIVTGVEAGDKFTLETEGRDIASIGGKKASENISRGGALFLGSLSAGLDTLGLGPEKKGGIEVIKKIAKESDPGTIKTLLKSIFPKMGDDAIEAAVPALVKADTPEAVQDITKSFEAPTTPAKDAFEETKPVTPLEKVDKFLAPPEKPKTPFKEMVGDLASNIKSKFVAEFNPLARTEKKIYKGKGLPTPKLNLAKKFELVAGSAGKAEADINEFQKAVIDPINSGKKIKNADKVKNVDNFNRYLFLERAKSRLIDDPTLKQVGSFTLDEVNQGLKDLEGIVGPEVFKKFDEVGKGNYQKIMDQALKLQVDSGRMSKELYNEIKRGNDFYAPYKVLKYADDVETAGGRGVETLTDLTKAITGIKKDDTAIGDILQASAEQIYKSRILAEKNLVMQELGKLADLGDGLIKKVPASKLTGEPGTNIVRYFKDGKEVALQVPEEVARAVKGMDKTTATLFTKALSMGAKPFRWGATAANAAFQVVNLFFADLPRQALLSKYGVGSVEDLVKFPMDWAYSFFTSVKGNFGKPNALFNEWLKSGAANSTIQREITPNVFKKTLKIPEHKSIATHFKEFPGLTLSSIAKFSNAIEETTKILTLKRGMRIENIAKLPEAERIAKMQELASEVRNFGGSPDFARQGSEIRELNLIFMFLNARIQGITSDLGRLTGSAGKGRALKSWAKLGSVVGVPTVTLALLNHSPEYEKDYYQIPERERQNYFMIPRNKFFTDDQGRKIREYYRIPKREIVSLFANMIEDSVEFAKKKDPKALGRYAEHLLEGISPINISGKNLTERAESVVSGMNPLIKGLVETGTKRNTYFHSDLIPQNLKNASPELQYKTNTAGVFKEIGGWLNVSPLVLEQLTGTLTGGGLNQFAVGKPLEGRGAATEFPIAKRFVRSSSVADTESDEAFQKALQKQTDTQIITSNDAKKTIAELKGKSDAEQKAILTEFVQGDPQRLKKLIDTAKEEALGLSYQEKRINQLNVRNGARAKFVVEEMNRLATNKEKREYLANLIKKKIVTDEVADQIIILLKQSQ